MLIKIDKTLKISLKSTNYANKIKIRIEMKLYVIG